MRYWPFALLGLAVGGYFGLVILAFLSQGSVRGS
jgi:hypothetical protein